MHIIHKFHLLQFFLALNFLSSTPIPEKINLKSCGKIPIQYPFLSSNSASSPLHRLILCKSQNLYFRTSIGLFPISSIDYASKSLVISHSSSFSSIHFVSPSLLSAGFPVPPQLINSLLFSNCSNPRNFTSEFSKNCSYLLGDLEKQEGGVESCCLMFDDVGKLKNSLNPNDVKCSQYKRVYRNGSEIEFKSEYKMGTVISFDIPEHVPNLCNECEKPYGHCGVALRCFCHVLECKDKVFSKSRMIKPDGEI